MYIELREMASGKVTGLQTFTATDDIPLNGVFSPDLRKMAAMIGGRSKTRMIVDISKLDAPAP